MAAKLKIEKRGDEIFTTPFETTFLVQVMFGKPCCQYEFKFTAIILNIARHKLFKPVGIKRDEIDKHSFLKLVCQQRS